MTDRIRLGLGFDAAALQRDLRALEREGWTDHFVTQNYDGDWGVIPLRGTAGATHPVAMIYSDPTATAFEDTPFLARAPAFQEALGAFECPLQSVRLMKLTPGSRIKEHTDHGLAAEAGAVRLHVPVTTNPGVRFVLNGTRVDMREGECWYLRLTDPHAVENGGTSDRVHLVIDAGVNPWLEAQLAGGTTPASRPAGWRQRLADWIRP